MINYFLILHVYWRNVYCFRIIYVYRYIVHIIQCTAVVGKPTENYVTLVVPIRCLTFRRLWIEWPRVDVIWRI